MLTVFDLDQTTFKIHLHNFLAELPSEMLTDKNLDTIIQELLAPTTKEGKELVEALIKGFDPKRAKYTEQTLTTAKELVNAVLLNTAKPLSDEAKKDAPTIIKNPTKLKEAFNAPGRKAIASNATHGAKAAAILFKTLELKKPEEIIVKSGMTGKFANGAKLPHLEDILEELKKQDESYDKSEIVFIDDDQGNLDSVKHMAITIKVDPSVNATPEYLELATKMANSKNTISLTDIPLGALSKKEIEDIVSDFSTKVVKTKVKVLFSDGDTISLLVVGKEDITAERETFETALQKAVADIVDPRTRVVSVKTALLEGKGGVTEEEVAAFVEACKKSDPKTFNFRADEEDKQIVDFEFAPKQTISIAAGGEQQKQVKKVLNALGYKGEVEGDLISFNPSTNQKAIIRAKEGNEFKERGEEPLVLSYANSILNEAGIYTKVIDLGFQDPDGDILPKGIEEAEEHDLVLDVLAFQDKMVVQVPYGLGNKDPVTLEKWFKNITANAANAANAADAPAKEAAASFVARLEVLSKDVDKEAAILKAGLEALGYTQAVDGAQASETTYTIDEASKQITFLVAQGVANEGLQKPQAAAAITVQSKADYEIQQAEREVAELEQGIQDIDEIEKLEKEISQGVKDLKDLEDLEREEKAGKRREEMISASQKARAMADRAKEIGKTVQPNLPKDLDQRLEAMVADRKKREASVLNPKETEVGEANRKLEGLRAELWELSEKEGEEKKVQALQEQRGQLNARIKILEKEIQEIKEKSTNLDNFGQEPPVEPKAPAQPPVEPKAPAQPPVEPKAPAQPPVEQPAPAQPPVEQPAQPSAQAKSEACQAAVDSIDLLSPNDIKTMRENVVAHVMALSNEEAFIKKIGKLGSEQLKAKATELQKTSDKIGEDKELFKKECAGLISWCDERSNKQPAWKEVAYVIGYNIAASVYKRLGNKAKHQEYAMKAEIAKSSLRFGTEVAEKIGKIKGELEKVKDLAPRAPKPRGGVAVTIPSR